MIVQIDADGTVSKTSTGSLAVMPLVCLTGDKGGNGFVRIALVAKSARIRFCLAALTEASLTGILSILVHTGIERIVIDIEDQAFVPQFFAGIEDAASWLVELGKYGLPSATPRFRSELLDMHRLSLRPGFLKHFAAWRRRRGEISAQDLRTMITHPLTPAELYTRFGAGDSVIPTTWPKYLRLYPPGDYGRMIGLPFDEHQDGGYLLLSAQSYLATRRAQAPRFEMVEAVMNPPYGPARRLRFERLLLPWRTPWGEEFVSATVFTRSKIAIPDAAGDGPAVMGLPDDPSAA